VTDAKAYWVGFNLVKGIGAARTRLLIDHFGTLEAAWNAERQQLLETGLAEKVVDTLLQVRRQVDLDRIWADIEHKGIKVFTVQEDSYPRRLKEIDLPPPVLFVRGEISADDDWAVGIVGTRRMTAYGRQVAEELAEFLARHGVTVISGLARGVDAAAHQAAINAGGRTYAILGCGVDVIYPPEHRKLAELITSNGALISEYALGTPPDSNNFPPRNRIISGLSQAVVVVEAGETSGALITAAFAADQGREVFAVPGYIHAQQSKGTNRLIRDGARPLLQVEDVLEVLNLEQVQEYRQARLQFPLDESEKRVVDALGDQSMHVDEIQVKSGLSIDKVSSTLVMMELKGMVRQTGGMTYMLVRERIAPYKVRNGI
jgi:DNA processing protein